MNIHIYACVLFSAVVVCGKIACMSWKRKTCTGAKSLFILMIAIIEWILCQLIEMYMTKHNEILFWHELKFLGIVIVPVAFLLFAAEYTKRKLFTQKNIIILLSIIPMLTLIIVFTNKFHGLFRQCISFRTINNIEVFDCKYGIWFWVHTFYSYILVLKGLVFLLIEFIYLPKLYRKQESIIIIGALIPWLWNICHVLYFKHIFYFDITPLTFVLTGIIFFWGIVRYKLLDLAPIAKKLVFESIDDIIIVLDKNIRIVDINTSAKKILKNRESEIIGEKIENILPELYKLLYEHNNVREKSINLNYKDEKRYFEVKDTNILDNEKRVMGTLIFLHDVTQQKKIMDKLKISQKKSEVANKAKSIFLANVSHEIRTPMNGILGMIDLMKTTKLDEEQSENLGIMRESAEALLSILNDILDYSKIQAGKMELQNIKFNVKKMIEDTAKVFSFEANKKQLAISWYMDEEIPDVLIGDSLRLRQIINNLISNAIKFTSEGNIEIKVEIAKRSLDKMVLRFIIKDTGIGIPKEKIENIFNSFEQVDSSRTRKYGGTGLGLSIVKYLVKLMNGSIEVESKLNSGTVFILIIPLKLCIQNNEDKIHIKKIVENSDREKNINILVAEDNKVNQLIMTKMLTKNGWSIKTVGNGYKVIEEVNNHHYDIVFMDIQMPVLDGYKAAIEIRKKNRNIPIIALTANTIGENRKKCLKVGMNDYISKPVIYSNIVKMINKYT